MKKNFFMTLLMMLLMTTAGRAQSNEHNMVITLQNGTTITLAPDDLKNITFNGEDISVEGNTIQDILARLEMQATYLYYLDSEVARPARILNEVLGHGSTDELGNCLEYLREACDIQLIERVKDLETLKAKLEDKIAELEKRIADLENK